MRQHGGCIAGKESATRAHKPLGLRPKEKGIKGGRGHNTVCALFGVFCILVACCSHFAHVALRVFWPRYGDGQQDACCFCVLPSDVYKCRRAGIGCSGCYCGTVRFCDDCYSTCGRDGARGYTEPLTSFFVVFWMWCYSPPKKRSKRNRDAAAGDACSSGNRRRVRRGGREVGAERHAPLVFVEMKGERSLFTGSYATLFPRPNVTSPSSREPDAGGVDGCAADGPVSPLTALLLRAAAEMCRAVVAAAVAARDHRRISAALAESGDVYDDPLTRVNIAAHASGAKGIRFRSRKRHTPVRFDSDRIRGCDVYAGLELLPPAIRSSPLMYRFAAQHSQMRQRSQPTLRKDKHIRVPALSLDVRHPPPSARSLGVARPCSGKAAAATAQLLLDLL